MTEPWQVWGGPEDPYLEVLKRRAEGELEPMAYMQLLGPLLKQGMQNGDSILDVGCGAGHLLCSLGDLSDVWFTYVGVDVTPSYIEAAREIWQDHQEWAQFVEGDIYDLSFPDASFDVVVCNNLLLHLPTLMHPLEELIRVTKKVLIVRTLIGTRAFAIKELWENGRFNYFNIYKLQDVNAMLNAMLRVARVRFISDTTMPPVDEHSSASGNQTRVIDGWQVNGYILEPWMFVVVEVE